MKKLLLIIPLLFVVSACHADTAIKWEKYCLPKVYLTPASLSKTANFDKNFDSNQGYGPSIFFNGAEIKNQIETFNATSPSPTSGNIYHHIQVNLSKTKITKYVLDTEQLKSSDMDNIKFEAQSPYNWTAYTNIANDYQYWGDCMLDGNSEMDPSYRCSHQLQIGNVFGTYSVEDENILLYQKIDDFIVNKLQSWECNE